MPNHLHEALIDYFRQHPDVSADLLTHTLHTPVPPHHTATLSDTNYSDIRPAEYRADVVIVLHHAEKPVFAIIIEIQLGRDTAKRWSWPVYLSTVRARLRCPTTLIVICPDSAIANWCAKPIHTGPGWAVTPQVIGPDKLPVITDPQQAAATPHLAVLAAIEHHHHPDLDKILQALPHALATLEPQLAMGYSDVMLAALPPAARQRLEDIVSTYAEEHHTEAPHFTDYILRGQRKGHERGREEGLERGMELGLEQGREEGRDEGRDEGREQGQIAGERTALLAVLQARGIHIPDHTRTTITDCTNLDQLTTWLHRAATATTTTEIFN